VRALVVAIVLLGAAVVEARPGGGSHYSGSSHSSSSSSSSHSSGSFHSYSGSSSGSYDGSSGGDSIGGPGVWLAVGLIVLVVLMFAIRANQGSSSAREDVTVDAKTRGEALAELKARDPEFDEARFAKRTLLVMARINEAWLRGDMGPARAFVSDGVYVRFQTYLALLRAAGLRNAMADWSADEAEIVAAQSDDRWDTVHVKIVGSARDRDLSTGLSPEQAERELKSAPIERYEEVWSFVRRRGKRSSAGAFSGAADGKCASCGAPLPLSEVIRCDHCKALTNSGDHDWVLAEITQPEEFDAADAAAEVPGLDAIRAHDPTVSRQELEDRASVMFWKWIEARVSGERKKLDRFCRSAGHPDADRAQLSEVAVGSCDAVHGASDPDGFDRAKVDVRWSARRDGGEPVNSLHRLVLVRSSQATSKRGLSCLDCPDCGGPLASSDDVKCRYCGATLTGAKTEWTLESLHLLS
jgi:hypothetical protein